MATTITIQIGALIANRVYQDDVKAAATLHAFYNAYNLGPADASNRQKLEAILRWITDTVQEKAKLHHVETSRSTVQQEADELYNLETPG